MSEKWDDIEVKEDIKFHGTFISPDELKKKTVVTGDAPPPSDMEKRIRETCDGLCKFLVAKNKSYGDSAANPVRIFSKADQLEQIYVRIDDKLSRIVKGHEYPGDNDILDLTGYLVLLMVIRKKMAEEAK